MLVNEVRPIGGRATAPNNVLWPMQTTRPLINVQLRLPHPSQQPLGFRLMPFHDNNIEHVLVTSARRVAPVSTSFTPPVFYKAKSGSSIIPKNHSSFAWPAVVLDSVLKCQITPMKNHLFAVVLGPLRYPSTASAVLWVSLRNLYRNLRFLFESLLRRPTDNDSSVPHQPVMWHAQEEIDRYGMRSMGWGLGVVATYFKSLPSS